jgi:cytidylate kinase
VQPEAGDLPTDSAGLVVALDGPSGVGKSTIARKLASKLELPYLDTGAMYRALGLKVLDEGLDPENQLAVEKIAEKVKLEVLPTSTGDFEILVDGRSVGESIRAPEVSQATSKIAAYPRVRAVMLDKQRAAAQGVGAVVEGRDIGTAVFPEAQHKFYLDAPVSVRSERRHAQLRSSGDLEVTLQEVEMEVRERDHRDSNRVASPLKLDASYRVINTAESSVEEIVDQIVRLVQDRGDP